MPFPIGYVADYLELDLQLSKDNVLIVFHDSEISGKLCRDSSGKIVTQPIPISDLTAQEIATYDCGSVAQKSFPDQKLIPKTAPPSLEEVFKLVKSEKSSIGLNVEIKISESTDPFFIAQATVALIQRYQLGPQVILQSFDFRTLKEAKKQDPSIRLSCLYENVADFCTPTVRFGAPIASPNFEMITPEKVRACHEQGLLVVPWTLNDETEWQSAARAGVDGIITDYPRKLISYLSTHSNHDAQ